MTAVSNTPPNAADGVTRVQAQRGEAFLYAIDLVGFSARTLEWISEDAELGIERTSDLVHSIFAALSKEFRPFGFRLGGFGGDALTLWSEDVSKVSDRPVLDAALQSALSSASTPIPCRVAHAAGPVWQGWTRSDDRKSPIIWGDTINTLFEDLSRATPLLPAPSTGGTSDAFSSQKLGGARLTRRSSLLVRIPPEQLGATNAEQLQQIFACIDTVLRHKRYSIDNAYQDDKGLILLCDLGRADISASAVEGELSAALDTVLTPLGIPFQIGIGFDETFQIDAELFGERLPLSFSHAINTAAKSLPSKRSVAVAPDRSGPRSTGPGPETRKLIGRESLLSEFSEALAAPRDGTNLIEVTGPAGIGKSVFVAHAIEAHTASDDRFSTVALRPHDAFAPYAAMRHIAQCCGLSTGLNTRWQDLLPTLAGALPTHFIIEDWHWSDSASHLLFPALLRLNPQSVIILIHRGQPHQYDALPIRSTAVSLDTLSMADVASVITDETGQSATPESVEIVNRLAAGNPFWTRELARELTVDSLAELDSSPGALPALDQLLRRRADRLSEEANALWRVYSTWGAPLAFREAKRLLERFGIQATSEHMEEIAALGWLTPAASHDAERSPVHQILAEWGRSDLPISVKHPLNALVARTLSQSSADPARIAEHWLSANDNDRASIMFERAAVQASRAGAHKLCLTMLEKARAASTRFETVSQTRSLIRKAHEVSSLWGLGELRRALVEIQRSDAARTSRPQHVAARAKEAALRVEAVRGETAHFSGNVPQVFVSIKRGRSLASEDDAVFDSSARRDGMIHLMLGLARLPVLSGMRRRIAKTEQDGQVRHAILLKMYHSTLLLCKCRWGDAIETASSARRAAEPLRDPLLTGTIITIEALHHLHVGDGEACISSFAELGHLADQDGNRLFKNWSYYGQGQGHLLLDQPEDAMRLGKIALQDRAGLGDHHSAIIVEGLLARAALALGDADEAIWRARRAARWGRTLPMSNFASLEGITAPAEIAVRLNRAHHASPETDELFKKGRSLLRSYARIFPLGRPRLALIDGLHLANRAQPDRAKRRIRKAHALATKLGMAHEVRLTQTALDQLNEVSP